MIDHPIIFLDCTLRDGGYYNDWNFSKDLIDQYLKSMQAAGVDVVELGLRSLKNEGFKGACAYTTDSFLQTLDIPRDLRVAVMVNAVELLAPHSSIDELMEMLFPESAESSPVSIVRIACHVHEFSSALPASEWLKKRGFIVGFNLMQVADRSQHEIEDLALQASKWPIDVLYFADSMGSMDPDQTSQIISWLRKYWHGPLGIHTHDNMGLALQNTLRALDNGATWLDATVTGMGRGPGNAKTEYLAIELSQLRAKTYNIVPLMSLIQRIFQPMQHQCGWGTNAYYYLTGKYGIHPSYIQEMLGDSRYSEEDILAVIEHLRIEGGKKFSLNTLDAARHFYQGPTRGSWSPATLINTREVLILGAGSGVAAHRDALESYIRKAKPFVLALNTQSKINAELIDARVACHPVRLLADCDQHTVLPQPLITPASMLPDDVKTVLQGKDLFDFGLEIKAGCFEFSDKYAAIPSSLVIAYALAVATSGNAKQILLAGFDGYAADDPRTTELQQLFDIYRSSQGSKNLISVTPTRYSITVRSIYAM